MFFQQCEIGHITIISVSNHALMQVSSDTAQTGRKVSLVNSMCFCWLLPCQWHYC